MKSREYTTGVTMPARTRVLALLLVAAMPAAATAQGKAGLNRYGNPPTV
jgi:hypothetical protein